MAKECEVMSKTYKEIRVLPAALKASGEMEAHGTYSETLGFYINETQRTALGVHIPNKEATLIINGEIVTVIKKSGQVWVAGDAIFWIEASNEYTNVNDGTGLLVGKAKIAAATGDATGDIVFKDYYPVQRGMQIGWSQIPYQITALFPDPIISLYAISALGAGINIESLKVHTKLEGIGSTGGRALFKLSTEVALGSWANALKAITDFGVAGEVAGLGSGFCAELILPSTGPSAGNYAPLEVELRIPETAGLGTKTSFMHIQAQGVGGSTGLGKFQTSGNLMSIVGVANTSNGLFDSTTITLANATDIVFDATLKLCVDGVDYFIPLSADRGFVA